MTEKEFKSFILSEYDSEDTFNYVFVAAFFSLGIYWFLDVEFREYKSTIDIIKNVGQVLAGILPILFAFSMLKGLSLSKTVIKLEFDATADEKHKAVNEYLSTKKNSKKVTIKSKEIEGYEYSSRLGIPMYLYSYIDGEQLMLLIRRKDDFSIKEIFDFGLTKRAQRSAKKFFEQKFNIS